MSSKFDEYFDTVLDYEADYSTHLEAWRVGALTMFDHLTDIMDELSEDGYKNLKEEVKGFMEGKE